MPAHIKALLYTSKKLANGDSPVMIRITKERIVKYLSTGFSCSPAQWDSNKQLPKKSHPLYQEARILIRKKELEAQKLVVDLENEDKHLSAHEIKEKLKRKSHANPSVLSYFTQVIKRLADSGQIKNSDIYRDTKKNLEYFTNAKDIHFSDVDLAFLNRFEEHLKSKGKGLSTISIYLRTFRALLNKAIKEGVCSDRYYPFKDFNFSKYANIKTEKRAITKDDIEKLKKVRLTDKDQKLAQDIFLFSFYCRGMNFTDLADLKWKNINENRLTYTRQKTGELFNIELLEPAIKILERYKPKDKTALTKYIFPILNESHVKPQTKFNRKVKMIGIVNKSLKAIASKAKISANLTTYVARHSYATILRKSGISTAIISQAMGHDSEKTTQIYLDSFSNTMLDEASKKIL